MTKYWSTHFEDQNCYRNGIHLGLTAIMAWLAVYLDLAHDVFLTECGFANMAHFGSEHTWSVIFLLAANAGVIGFLAASVLVRLASVLVLATVHGVFAGCLLLSNVNAWSGTYAIIALMGYYLAYLQTRTGLSLLRRVIIDKPAGSADE